MSILDDVICNLRALLLSSKGGLPISEIDREYAATFGPFQPAKIGFKSLHELLRNSPENFIFYGDCVLATVKSTSAHIADLISKQKTSRKQKRADKFQKALEVLCEHKGHKKHMKKRSERASGFKSEKILSSQVGVKNFEYKRYDKINPYSIWKIAVKVFANNPSKTYRKTFTSSKNIDPYEIRRIVHKISREKNYNQGPLKWLQSGPRHISHGYRERRDASSYNPNGWNFVSNALKKYGAISQKDRERSPRQDHCKTHKKDFSNDSIDEGNYFTFE